MDFDTLSTSMNIRVEDLGCDGPHLSHYLHQCDGCGLAHQQIAKGRTASLPQPSLPGGAVTAEWEEGIEGEVEKRKMMTRGVKPPPLSR